MPVTPPARAPDDKSTSNRLGEPRARSKAIDHAGAERAEDDPVYVEQTDRGGVQKEVDHFRFRQVPLGRETHWIDAKEGHVIRRSDGFRASRPSAGSILWRMPLRARRGVRQTTFR
jgi:hypothetical protein